MAQLKAAPGHGRCRRGAGCFGDFGRTGRLRSGRPACPVASPWLKLEKGRSGVGKAGESYGQGTRGGTYLLMIKKFPTRHSTEGTVEAMEM